MTLINTSFVHNTAGSYGPAVSNIGNVDQMADVTFGGNTFVCHDGQYAENVKVRYTPHAGAIWPNVVEILDL